MPGSIFPTTRGSIVAALASEDRDQRARAFDTFTQIYRAPLLTYARVAHRHDDAEDVTQSFLVVAFERDSLASYDPQKASFRTFCARCSTASSRMTRVQQRDKNAVDT